MVSDNKNKNVYVGHRYVPKIFGVWDKLKTYEGLSIVTWEGTSYTSKKRVPEGVDILNEEYWVVTGNYNAQIENYRQEVRNMGDYVDGEVNNLTNYVNSEVDSKANQVDLDETNSQLAQTDIDLQQEVSTSISLKNMYQCKHSSKPKRLGLDRSIREAINYCSENNVHKIFIRRSLSNNR